MRAVFLKEINISDCSSGKSIEVSGEQAKHLIKSVRIKSGEEVQVFNGSGQSLLCKVTDVLKKSCVLNVLQILTHDRKHRISLLTCCPKKDALEDIIRMSVELGAEEIFCAKSDYSQFEVLKPERFERIIESALVQSNNPFWPKMTWSCNLSDLESLSKQFDRIIYCCSRPSESNLIDKLLKDQTILIIIGPEAGLSLEEEKAISSLDKSSSVHFKTNILRAPTATCVAFGHVQSLLI